MKSVINEIYRRYCDRFRFDTCIHKYIDHYNGDLFNMTFFHFQSFVGDGLNRATKNK